MKKSNIILLFTACLFAACKPNIKSDAPSSGGVDFSSYVAIGNSLTAGYADGSLYRSGQMNSYPAILAEQLKLVGGGAFNQPLLPGEYGYPSAKLVLGFATDCMGVTGLGPMPAPGTPDTGGSSTNIALQGPFNNLGVPGIRAIDYLQPGYAFFNPYAARFYTNPLGTPLDEAKLTNPTFFTMWLGSNDVLGYALSGGEGNPLPYHPDNISNEGQFHVAYDSVVKTMVRTGAKGVLINIPDVTSIPFFTTIPSKGLILDAASAAGLNAAYAGTGITFTEGPNNFVIQDLSAPGGRRKMKDNELILLSTPQDSMKCAGWGTIKPIPKSLVLTEDEIDAIHTAMNKFNGYIQSEAILYHVALLDINSYLKTLSAGVKFNGVSFNTQYIAGGAFSLDGIHLTPRGYALAANQIIGTVNAYYKSTIPMVDVNKYPGIKIP